MTPPICGRIVTVEIGMTWPTGGGSINTGTFVATDLAASTGTGTLAFGSLVREHAPVKINAAKTAGMKNALFITDLFRRSSAGFEGRRKFLQEFPVFSLKLGIVNGLARGQRDQFRQGRRKQRQRLHGQRQMSRVEGGGQLSPLLPLAETPQPAGGRRAPFFFINHFFGVVLEDRKSTRLN